MVRLSPIEGEKYRPVWTAILELVGNCRVSLAGKMNLFIDVKYTAVTDVMKEFLAR